MKEAPCVVPVSADDALAWAVGELQDSDLLLRTPLVPEAVFLVNLPNRESYAEVLRQVAHWKRQGAVCLIARTGNDVVANHITLKNHGLITFREASDRIRNAKYRFFVPPADFSRWVDKFAPAPVQRHD